MASAASTSETEARRSVAITGAGVRLGRPRTMAMPPSTWMSAPILTSSGTCMKRFSNTVSEIRDDPSARHISAMNWACRSVGKPGKGSVVISVEVTVPVPATWMESQSSVTDTPASFSTSNSESRCRGRAL